MIQTKKVVLLDRGEKACVFVGTGITMKKMGIYGLPVFHLFSKEPI